MVQMIRRSGGLRPLGLVDPFREMERLFGHPAQPGPIELDLRDTEEEFLVRVEVPGIEPAELSVSVIDDVLTIEGEKRDDREQEGEGWRVTERRFGKVCRRVALPTPVDADKVSAETKNGVLTVRLPKSQAAQPKVIPVSAAD